MLVLAADNAIEHVLDKTHRWENPASGNSGSITLVRRFRLDESDCVEARITISNARQSVLDELESYCRGANGKWTAAEAPAPATGN